MFVLHELRMRSVAWLERPCSSSLSLRCSRRLVGALLGLTLLPCPAWVAGMASLLVMTVGGDTMAESSILGLPELLLPLDSVFLLALSVLGSKVGLAKPFTVVQSWRKASVASANGSGHQLK